MSLLYFLIVLVVFLLLDCWQQTGKPVLLICKLLLLKRKLFTSGPNITSLIYAKMHRGRVEGGEQSF